MSPPLPPSACPRCSAPAAPGAAFCTLCGQALGSASTRISPLLILGILSGIGLISLSAFLIGFSLLRQPRGSQTPAATAEGALIPTPLPTLAPAGENAPQPSEPPPVEASPLPALPASGRIIYTCETRQKENQIYDQICMINADGSGETRLTTGDIFSSYYPSLAPDGSGFVFVSNRNGDHEIYYQDFATGSARPLTSTGGDFSSPEISPDGQQLVYVNRNASGKYAIFVQNFPAGEVVEIYANKGIRPTWTADNRILFVNTENGIIYRMNADGSQVEVLAEVARLGGRAELSPDGRILAYFAGLPEARQIYTLDLTTGERHQLTFEGDNYTPTFSPDGGWLAFTSYGFGENRHGLCKIYKMRLDGSEKQQLSTNPLCDWLPNWGP